MSTITADMLAYLNELAADIAEHGGFGDMTIEQAMKEAHKRRQAFAQEMADQKTARSKMAAEALAAAVWIRLSSEGAIKRMERNCIWITS